MQDFTSLSPDSMHRNLHFLMLVVRMATSDLSDGSWAQAV
jgi:hypothetical protein